MRRRHGTVIGIEVAGEDTCAMNGAQAITGSWLRVRHPADRAAILSLRVISTPAECDATGAGCPTAHVTRGGVAPCTCPSGGLDFFSLPLTGPFELPLITPERAVLLGPAGAVYEVSICVNDGDPFPICDPGGGCFATATVTTSGHCACAPPCRDDDDCPQPSSGTVRPHCEPLGCTLPCRPEDVCPGTQTCVNSGEMSGPICMNLL